MLLINSVTLPEPSGAAGDDHCHGAVVNMVVPPREPRASPVHHRAALEGVDGGAEEGDIGDKEAVEAQRALPGVPRGCQRRALAAMPPLLHRRRYAGQCCGVAAQPLEAPRQADDHRGGWRRRPRRQRDQHQYQGRGASQRSRRRSRRWSSSSGTARTAAGRMPWSACTGYSRARPTRARPSPQAPCLPSPPCSPPTAMTSPVTALS
uniref:Uncharacterized protein n=1 Tax=Oryza glaberrima TaxID=4538 RepID=I1Q9T8_ORYGL